MFDALHRIETKLDRLLVLIERYHQEDEKMSAELDQAYQDLAGQVAANTSVESSAVTVIQQLVTRLQATLNTNTDDTAKVAAVQQEISAMKASQTLLANAIISGTAAASPTAPPPVSSGTTSATGSATIGATSGTTVTSGGTTSGATTS